MKQRQSRIVRQRIGHGIVHGSINRTTEIKTIRELQRALKLDRNDDWPIERLRRADIPLEGLLP